MASGAVEGSTMPLPPIYTLITFRHVLKENSAKTRKTPQCVGVHAQDVGQWPIADGTCKLARGPVIKGKRHTF